MDRIDKLQRFFSAISIAEKTGDYSSPDCEPFAWRRLADTPYRSMVWRMAWQKYPEIHPDIMPVWAVREIAQTLEENLDAEGLVALIDETAGMRPIPPCRY